MANENNQTRKKKKGGGGWGLLVLVALWMINGLGKSGNVKRFFERLRWSLRTGDFSMNGGAIAVIAGVLLIILLSVVIVRLKKLRSAKRFDGIKARGGGTAAAHSHDRLQGYHGEESGADHWKKQLDGFLEAGIIDRSEYRVLLERRRR